MSVIDLSLLKGGPGGTLGFGGSGPATIDGWQFRIDPSSVQLPIRAKVQKYRTIGGFVVQVYGTTWGDLTLTGQFGDVGQGGGWPGQVAFMNKMVQVAGDQAMQRQPQFPGQNFSPAQPFRFNWPLLGWDFMCYLKSYTSDDGDFAVHMENTNINPKWTLTLFVVTDNNGKIGELTQSAYLQRLAPGLGVMWDSTTEQYQGYQMDQYNAPLTGTDLQTYINNPVKGGSSDVVSPATSTVSGPTSPTPPPGSTATDASHITSSLTFAQAFLTAIGAHITNTNTNLVRAWEMSEGMWNSSYPVPNYPGGAASWNAMHMNNPLNIGGGTAGSSGQKGTYTAGSKTYQVTYLVGTIPGGGSTGVTYSFNGDWAAGLDSVVYFANSNFPNIVQALKDNSEAEFWQHVGYWNDPSTGAPGYVARMQGIYDGKQYESGY
jgi:hypothetical protein